MSLTVTAASGREEFELRIPDSAELFVSTYPAPATTAADIVLDAVRAPLGAAPEGGADGVENRPPSDRARFTTAGRCRRRRFRSDPAHSLCDIFARPSRRD
jgi:hypothetical protein